MRAAVDMPLSRLLPLAGVVVLVAGCATSGPRDGTTATAASAAPAPAPTDPWEAWNRKVFAFNDTVDEAVLKPVATAYRRVVPELVRTGVDNVLGNIGDVWSTANHFLQAKPQTGLEMGMRVLTNTVFGLGGLLDPATEMRLPRRSEDMGQTLGRWGLPTGPYVVLPLLGPSNARDTAGTAVDLQFSASNLPQTWVGSTAVTVVDVVNTRSNFLSATQVLDQVALDRYSFVRDGYLQSRLNDVYDGSPPLEAFQDEPADPSAPAGAAPRGPAPAGAAPRGPAPAGTAPRGTTPTAPVARPPAPAGPASAAGPATAARAAPAASAVPSR